MKKAEWKKMKIIKEIVESIKIMIVAYISISIIHELGHIFFLVLFNIDFTIAIISIEMIGLNIDIPHETPDIILSLILSGGILFQILFSLICLCLIRYKQLPNNFFCSLIFVFPISNTIWLIDYLIRDLFIFKIGDYFQLMEHHPTTLYILLGIILIFIIGEIYVYLMEINGRKGR